MASQKLPRRIYKYRGFSNLTLESLVADQLWYADPSTFNDPLDTRPSLNADLDVQALESVLGRLVENRVRAEMSAAAKTISYQGPKTMDHIERHSRRRAEQLIADIAYNATNPDYDFGDPHVFLLGQYIEEELLRQYDKGIISFAVRATCPLMWSHYGEQHNGICIGYSVPAKVASDINRVEYGGSRLVDASDVAKMLGGDETARKKVDSAVLLRKAGDWRYEREWRLTGPRGLQDSPLELEEVIFGMRCKSPVMYAVAKALENRGRAVKFYEMREVASTFKLKKVPLDLDELAASLPRWSRALHDAFDQLP
ncbi:DUF2971 domain-containing protein [Agrobacterium vitis]|uniref:DUF2971 domain-containing protein n=1 Tax=Agrobacterium vitis TaxID=373 RepID=UPI001F43F1D5|nr:DUF2971 domain-containing protein [Agrobacterium vitis]MCF1467587.1 DUF2971 domain-containing protein [Agrobacterium vitis]